MPKKKVNRLTAPISKKQQELYKDWYKGKRKGRRVGTGGPVVLGPKKAVGETRKTTPPKNPNRVNAGRSAWESKTASEKAAALERLNQSRQKKRKK
jgi:hypothetical protein